MPHNPPWEGQTLCGEPTAKGTPCTHREIEGLGACFWHLPDELLEEAEEITGMRRCRHGYGGPDACHFQATEGTEPPACKNHGANAGSVTSREAGRRVIEGRVADRMSVIMSEQGEKLLKPKPVGNHLQELLDVAAEIKAFREIMRDVVAQLDPSQYRYGSKVGEQARAEVLLYERALDRNANVLLAIAKLNIASQLAKIEQNKVAAITRALNLALQASGAGLEGQQAAREVLQRELRAVA